MPLSIKILQQSREGKVQRIYMFFSLLKQTNKNENINIGSNLLYTSSQPCHLTL